MMFLPFLYSLLFEYGIKLAYSKLDNKLSLEKMKYFTWVVVAFTTVLHNYVSCLVYAGIKRLHVCTIQQGSRKRFRAVPHVQHVYLP